MLFAYWDGIRGDRAAPERSDVKPGHIRHILADTFVLAREETGEAVFRLSGTRCEALFGQDLKGVPFTTLFPAAEREGASRLTDTVARETIGLVAGLTGLTDAGTSVALELLLLPLRHGGRTDSRLIGALSTRTLPSWIGLFPVTRLEVGSLRIVHASDDPIGVPPEPASGPAERRRRFVVHQGGRERATISIEQPIV